MQKLYVLTRNDLSPGQQAVQSAHAVAEFLQQHETTWDNGTLVLLGVHKHRLELWENGPLLLNETVFSSFYEPDISATTSLAFVLDEDNEQDDYIRNLLDREKLLLKEKRPNLLERFIQGEDPLSLVKDQKPLPPEASKIIEENFSDLI